MDLLPSEDGQTHINVYSKGLTMVGRWCSNFTRAPFEHPRYGHFESVEGLWYWLSCPAAAPGREALRGLWGYEAKRYGRTLRAQDWPKDPQFEEFVLEGIRAKLAAHRYEAQLLRATTLPLVHYYVFGSGQVHDQTQAAKFMLNEFDKWRKS